MHQLVSVLTATLVVLLSVLSRESFGYQLDFKTFESTYLSRFKAFRPARKFDNERDQLRYDWADAAKLTQYERNEKLFLSNETEYACLGYYDNLAHASSVFIECSINNSRPFHLCQNCAQSYLQVKESYNLILEVRTSSVTTNKMTQI